MIVNTTHRPLENHVQRVRTVCARVWWSGRLLGALTLMSTLTACSVGGLSPADQTAVAVANVATANARTQIQTATGVVDAQRTATASRAASSGTAGLSTVTASATTSTPTTNATTATPSTAAGNVTGSPSPSTPGRIYTDPQKRFSLVVPDGWQLQQTQVPGVTVQFASDRLRGNVNVVTEDAPNVTLDQYVTTTIANIKHTYSDFVADPKGVQTATIGGKPAQRYEFSGTQQQARIRVTQIATINGQTAYIITFTVQTDDAEAFADQANAILKSFVFREADG